MYGDSERKICFQALAASSTRKWSKLTFHEGLHDLDAAELFVLAGSFKVRFVGHDTVDIDVPFTQDYSTSLCLARSVSEFHGRTTVKINGDAQFYLSSRRPRRDAS